MTQPSPDPLSPVLEPETPKIPAHRPQSIHAHIHFVFPNLLDSFRSLLVILVAAVFVLTFVVQPFRIPSESMERTLLVGDFLLVDKSVFGAPGHWGWLLPYQPVRRDDIVVFHFPLSPSEHVVKRVVGLPGNRVRLENGVVYINGQKQEEPFAVFEPSYPDNFRDDFPAANSFDPGVDSNWWLDMRGDVSDGQLKVPAGDYFVLGDNRNNSRDSRYWGFVQPNRIEGRPLLIYFSLREPSTTDVASLPDDKLGHEQDPIEAIVDFARWTRMFRVVR
ncbi:MAG TPA: signal peptidase I [Acidobacteriaceae bacterium]|nr:signal peptidase I [Acidobacteriaceae bacterium]